MKIFRVETRKGFGPYASRVLDSRMNKVCHLFEEDHNNGSHPTIQEEEIPMCMGRGSLFEYGKIRRDVFFGFSSITQLENWFNEKERKILRNFETEYYLVEYEVEDELFFITTKTQCIFRKDKALKIKRLRFIENGYELMEEFFDEEQFKHQRISND